MTAVHTLGRLPLAADRAILPLRIPEDWARARQMVLGKPGTENKPRLSFPDLVGSVRGLLKP